MKKRLMPAPGLYHRWVILLWGALIASVVVLGVGWVIMLSGTYLETDRIELNRLQLQFEQCSFKDFSLDDFRRHQQLEAKVSSAISADALLVSVGLYGLFVVVTLLAGQRLIRWLWLGGVDELG